MTFRMYKPTPLNEALLGNCNMESPEDDVCVVGTSTVGFADAINTHKAIQNKVDKDLKDFKKNAKEFVDRNHKREVKTEKTKEMKLMKLSEELFEDAKDVTLNKDSLVEGPAKKRTRSENEKKWIGDYSSEDLWYAVYDELSATTDNEGSGQQVNKQIKARRGERYENVYPHGDNDIIIYATKPEEFEFARRVADHYGVIAEEPKQDTNKNTNGFYKYSMIIRIPEDGLYQGE